MNARINLFLLLALVVFSFTSNAQPRRDRDIWERLGTRAVNFGLDHDVIHVGAKEGGFTKLKIEVTGGALNMHRMVVEYMNGETEEIELRHNFSRGTGSRVIDIKGGTRLIKEIRFFYDTKNMARSRAKVTVFGKK